MSFFVVYCISTDLTYVKGSSKRTLGYVFAASVRLLPAASSNCKTFTDRLGKGLFYSERKGVFIFGNLEANV